MKIYSIIFDELVSAKRLFEAWYEFRKGKGNRQDVQEFERHLEKNIFRLHRDLISQKYEHSYYTSFFIYDPKLRHIRKACVRDRIVQQTLYTTLTQIYDKQFIHNVYSSRIGKGTHKAVKNFGRFVFKVSRNFTRTCWTLKCDIRKFYDSIDHEILFKVLCKTIKDEKALRLLNNIIGSFHIEGVKGKGAPIGNLTSQIFTNVYLNEFDQFLKHNLRIKYYLRFADDCLFLSHKKQELVALIPKIQEFLSQHLKLILHPNKIILRPIQQGVDFLGYVTLPHHKVIRKTTERRMIRKLKKIQKDLYQDKLTNKNMHQSLQSYLGMLSHANAHALSQELLNVFLWKKL
jgi:retron-type reverse transcriptase